MMPRHYSGLIFTLLVTALISAAPDATANPLTPYKATYSTSAMGLGMTLTRELSEVDDGWRLSNEGSVFVASLSEIAHFTLNDHRIVGRDFKYKLSGITRRKREVQFLPDEGIIRSLRKKVWTEHPWEADVLDRLSQQEQLKLDLIASDEPPERLAFRVVDGDRIKERVLHLVGEETLETDVGTLETVHYRRDFGADSDRASDIWLAPSLDYTMVLTVHDEEGSEIRIAIKSYEPTPQ